jgi:hypothetical protein
MKKSKYFRFTLVGEGSYIQPLDDLMTALDGELDHIKAGYVGDKVTIELEVIEMTDEEYSALPEFQGW